MRRRGADCLVLAMKRGNARGAKGAGHRHWIGSTSNGTNPIVNGRRQPSCDGSRLRRSEMPVVARDDGVAVDKRGFDHQYVGVANVFGQSLGGSGIAHDDQLRAAFRRTKDVFGVDRPTIRERQRLPSANPLRTGPSGTPRASRRSGRRWRRGELSKENPKLSVSRWRTGKQSIANSPASMTRGGSRHIIFGL
jgi:hypothetical protein